MTFKQEEDFQQLLDVGIALSSERDLNKLLTMILSETRRFTIADAGTLYLVDGPNLRAEVGQCDTFVERWGAEKAAGIFKTFSFPISRESIAGAAADMKEIINIPDVQDKETRGPFSYNPEFDKQNNYSTHSNLAVPMMDKEGTVIGVLQLINATENDRIVAFDDYRVRMARALASQAGVALSNALLTSELKEAHLDTLRRLGVAAEWRDKETANHITRVSHYSAILAKTMGWSEYDIEMIRISSAMHDVGKLGIPDSILHKPGRLEPEERKVMETHALIGANIMAKAGNEVMKWSREIALGHHEKWDGTGYPFNAAGKDIPVSCCIVAMADVYDALSSKRCYKDAFPHDKVMSIINEDTGTHFSPAVVEAFKTSIDDIIFIRDKYKDTDEDFAKFRDYTHIELEE
ncbi:MAG: HD domain-containing phosphohydrolase [Planctomycetota bacterium]|jgi:HD-GYP domain-containing protein (c-di-GMP phosphodiesterase class II)